MDRTLKLDYFFLCEYRFKVKVSYFSLPCRSFKWELGASRNCLHYLCHQAKRNIIPTPVYYFLVHALLVKEQIDKTNRQRHIDRHTGWFLPAQSVDIHTSIPLFNYLSDRRSYVTVAHSFIPVVTSFLLRNILQFFFINQYVPDNRIFWIE